MTRTLACAALLALTPLPALAQEYVGTWASDVSTCRNGQEVEDAPMIMRAGRYDEHETHCTFSSVRKSGAGWTVRSRCVVEGNNVTSNFTMRLDGAMLSLIDSSGTRTLQRCP